jgi:PilZ domain-containing protein
METETVWKGARFGERRIGERFQAEEPRMGWRVPQKSGNARRDRRRTPNSECRFLDVSITGARLLAPEEMDLRVGSQILVDYNGEPTSVKIRRVERHNHAFSVYGVSFIELGPRLKQIVYAADTKRSQRHGTVAS